MMNISYEVRCLRKNEELLTLKSKEQIKKIIKKELLGIREERVVGVVKFFNIYPSLNKLDKKQENKDREKKQGKIGKVLQDIIYILKPLNRVLNHAQIEKSSKSARTVTLATEILTAWRILILKLIEQIDENCTEALIEEKGGGLYASYEIKGTKEKLSISYDIGIKVGEKRSTDFIPKKGDKK